MTFCRIDLRLLLCRLVSLAVTIPIASANLHASDRIAAQGLSEPVPTLSPPRALPGGVPPLPVPDTDQVPVSSLKETPYLGVQSCASSSCHGNPGGGDLLQSAYVIFQQNDPHIRAGAVLFNEKSQAIAERLKLSEPAWKSNACLVCHAPGAMDMQNDPRIKTLVSEGVSCESCHGPAQDWLVPHRSLDWKNPAIWPASRKKEAGYVVTKSLTVRANLCADCHVGSVRGQVDHDLIAAGHPRLLFEFSGDQDVLPAHWKRSVDRKRLQAETGSSRASFEATAWLLGQLVCADRELELLAHAAANPNRAWPELSQYDCFACHQDLNASNLQAGAGSAGSAGKLRWGTWNLGLLQTAPQVVLSQDASAYQADSEQLNKLLRSFSEDREQVLKLTTSQRQRLDLELSKRPAHYFIDRDVAQLRDSLLKSHQQFAFQGWDTSTQFYLAIAALQLGVSETQGESQITDPNLRALLQEIRSQLSFRKASPIRPDVIYDSPRGFDRDAKANLNELFMRYQSEVTGTPSALIITPEVR